MKIRRLREKKNKAAVTGCYFGQDGLLSSEMK
jgi:hypothetical protein